MCNSDQEKGLLIQVSVTRATMLYEVQIDRLYAMVLKAVQGNLDVRCQCTTGV